MVCTWLGELCSCSCLTVLPDSAWVLHDEIYKPFSPTSTPFTILGGDKGVCVECLQICETRLLKKHLYLKHLYVVKER